MFYRLLLIFLLAGFFGSWFTPGILCQIRIEAESMQIHSAPDVDPVPLVMTDSSCYMWSWGTLTFKTQLQNQSYKIRIRAREDHAGEDFAQCEMYASDYLCYFEINKETFDIYEAEIKSLGDSIHFFHYGNDYPNERNVELDWIEFVPLQTIPDTGKVILAWDANTEPDLAGYKVYYGMESRKYLKSYDVGDTTQFKLYWLPMNVRLYFTATAYDTIPNESLFGNEVDTLIESEVFEYQKGDWNKDRKISLVDIVQFTKRFGAFLNDPEYDIVFDFDEDGKIYLYDIVQITKIYGLIY